MNTKLLDETVAYVDEVPERFNMNEYYEYLGEGEDLDYLPEDFHLRGPEDVPACGSIGCLAGNVCIVGKLCGRPIVKGDLREYHAPSDGWPVAAKKALKLTSQQACALFFTDKKMAEANSWRFKLTPDDIKEGWYWPTKFGTAYENAKTPRERVNVLKERIAYFKEAGK